MVRQSILKGLLILYGIYVVMIGKEIGRKEEMPENYCSVEEFEGLDYYLFCDTQIHKDVANFESRPSIISSGTKNIEEAGKLYQEFKKRLPLGQEGKDEEGEESNVIYVSPDCKWVVANKWSEHKSISTQELFYEKEKVREKVSEAGQGVEQKSRRIHRLRVFISWRRKRERLPIFIGLMRIRRRTLWNTVILCGLKRSI